MNILRAFLLLSALLILMKEGRSQANPYNLGISPNPFDDSLFVSFNLPGMDTVTGIIFDLAGNPIDTMFYFQLFTPGFHQVGLQYPLLNSGVYLLLLRVNSSIAVEKMIKNSDPVSRSHKVQSQDYQFFPNPTTGILCIPLQGTKLILVRDIQGKLIMQSETENDKISLSNLNDGTYFVTIRQMMKEEELLSGMVILRK